MAPVLLVNGSGILHHRHAGIASHLGVVAETPTIGVTKTLLCGRVEIEGMQPGESRPVVHEDRPISVALRPTAGSRRPISSRPAIAWTWRGRAGGSRLLLGRRCPSRSIGPTASAARPENRD